jgi:phosphoglucosamine mutase
MKRLYFGTDGVRGPYGGPVVNEEFAAQLGFAAAAWLKQKGRVFIGRDTRFSGESLEAAVAAGLSAAGATPISLGVVPTPAVARTVRGRAGSLGVVITASHNPAGDNGIKFFGANGVKLTDEEEAKIETLLPKPLGNVTNFTRHWPSGEGQVLAGAAADYVSAASRILATGSIGGWRIVLDTANGATCQTSPVVLRGLGAEVVGIGDKPDGRNINLNVGSEYPALLSEQVRARRAGLGIAHDGDGDRCVLCDETGDVLDGDEILAILALHALSRGTLPRKTLVVTVQSNLGVDAAVNAAGGRVCRTPVGDRYVIERMFAEGAALGGESSGHIICAEISPTGDGLVAAMKVIEVMLATGRPLSELRRVLKKFPQRTSALKVRVKKPLETLPNLTRAIEKLEKEMGALGRVLVRYSGTEAKLRLLIEGPTDAVVTIGIAQLEKAARTDLEVL